MKRVRITLKNYRGFVDSEPVIFEISPGFTAIVGRNNSGKSTLKLFIYEFRELLAQFGSPLNLHGSTALRGAFIQNWSYSFNCRGIADTEEIFNNSNRRPLSVEIEVLEPTARLENATGLRRVVLTCPRPPEGQTPQWTMQAFGTDNLRQLLHSPPGTAPNIVQSFGVALPKFNVDCLDFIEVCHALADAQFYGPFRNALNQGAGEHFDLRIGTSFIELWNEWKTSGSKAKTRAIDQVTEDIRRLYEFDRLEINTSAKLNTLIVSINGQPYRLSELGSGLTQFIMVLGNAATRNPSLLLVDEPETNLHPALQIDFLLSLAQYARDGVVFSTHSIGLARSVADHIYSVQKLEDRTVVRPFEATPNYLEFVGELSFSTFKELGSDKLLLVEGVTDVKSVQQLLRLVKKEHTTVILPLGGDQLAVGGRDQELAELKRLSNNIFALVDSERKQAEDAPSDRRVKFLETCMACGIDACATERRAIENYFTERAVKAAFGDNFQALGPYELLKEGRTPWSKADNWKIARQMTLAELEGTDLGDFLAHI